VLVSPVAHGESLVRMGIDPKRPPKRGQPLHRPATLSGISSRERVAAFEVFRSLDL